MSSEMFRKNLIRLLKTSKIYYLSRDKEVERIYTKEQIEAEKRAKNEMYSILMNQYAMNMIMYGEGHLELPINNLMNKEIQELQEICNKSALDIQDNDSLEVIAQKLSEIGKDDLNEDEIDEKLLEDTLLYKLRKSREDNSEYNFVRDNKKLV